MYTDTMKRKALEQGMDNETVKHKALLQGKDNGNKTQCEMKPYVY